MDGNGHSSLWTIYNMAAVQALATGNLLTAQEILLAGLRDGETLRELDEELVSNINRLADTYYGQGKLSGAELLIRRVLGSQERILGVRHPEVTCSLSRLTTILRCDGRDEEARLMETRLILLKGAVLA